ncbi:alpha/beta fold hydrolase [Geodermatophilus obscurus]|uniref:Alpha/beta hydrolase fold protein n=1 Tax=Geodermatophilus obscurus (strain ATCC 25078 / DSM 43160 / JCM 3152 / CCUG 61914 / KCC A-0152 / KCTC 9177 / NBRC 13315 / NRRL B-3577 / G-20) TaxID=526225 RepID=D2S5Q2_GEOOG|nr:alpha/beta hydrolase [Geodermatophilus obscurus]ADB77308.1 alpha/beta hydrolase fold protein [Geodermatophilus obscurus DSM 43160]
MSGIVHRSGGSGDHLLLLLHGLGATGAVWDRLLPLVERSWPGPWAVLDLRGHGRSVAGPPYGYAVHAADAASLVAGSGAAQVTVLGHSFGGVVGAVLAGGWYGVQVERVVAVGVKIDWTDDEVARARSLAARPPQVFATAAEAADRHLRLAGLTGLVDPSSAVAAAGVREVDGGFVAALDPRAFGAVGPPVEEVLSRAVAPLRLAAGAADPMVGLDAMRRVDPEAVLIEGAGHNAHWEAPEAVWSLVSGG